MNLFMETRKKIQIDCQFLGELLNVCITRSWDFYPDTLVRMYFSDSITNSMSIILIYIILYY